MKRTTTTTATLVLLFGLSLAACTSEAPVAAPEDGNTVAAAAADNPREAKFKQIGKANKAIGEELKKPAPSIDAVKGNATTLAALATDLPNWFPAGSGPESGSDTEALPAIWEKPAEFSKASGDFLAAAKALEAAAGTGDVAKVQAASKDLGGTCKACHQQFRKKD